MRKVLVSVLAAFGLLLTVGSADAQEEFDVTVKGTEVTIVMKGAWHVNKEYPWKLKAGDKVVADKAKFALDDKKAVVSAPKGKTTLKGAVCNGPQCKNFEVDVNVN